MTAIDSTVLTQDIDIKKQRNIWLDEIIKELRNPINYAYVHGKLREGDPDDSIKNVCALGLIADIVDPDGWSFERDSEAWLYLGLNVDQDFIDYKHRGYYDSLDFEYFYSLLGINLSGLQILHHIDDCGDNRTCIPCEINEGFMNCSYECSGYSGYIHGVDYFSEDLETEEDSYSEEHEPDYCTCLEEFGCICDCDCMELTEASDELQERGWELIADTLVTYISS